MPLCGRQTKIPLIGLRLTCRVEGRYARPDRPRSGRPDLPGPATRQWSRSETPPGDCGTRSRRSVSSHPRNCFGDGELASPRHRATTHRACRLSGGRSMDMATGAAITSMLVALLATCVAVFAADFSRKQAAAAKVKAEAAGVQAAEARRQADAAEAQAITAREQADASWAQLTRRAREPDRERRTYGEARRRRGQVDRDRGRPGRLAANRGA